MNKYVIEISERLTRQEIIEAETEQEAIEKAQTRYRDGEIVLDSDDFDDVDYECVEAREEPKYNYETICILDTKAKLKDMNEVINFIKNQFEEVTKTELIGVKKLAYEIKEHNDGFYIIVNMSGTKENVTELERYYRLNDNVLKFVVVKL